MKIGIISINMYSKGLNFACPLHNYAFQQFLLKNGIESTIISYKPIYFNNFDLRHPYDYYARMCNNFVSSGRNKTEINEWKRISGLRDSWKELYYERERRYDKFQNFIDSNYIKTEECYDSDLLEIKDPGFDCYICCTDVIWKKEPNIGFDRGFFLASKAMENKWKISYAASRGVFFSENEEDENTFLHYVQDIDAISVREDSLKKYLDENIDNEVTKVLDPVLLHDKEFYENILVKPKEEHYLFLYYVMERAEDTIDQAVKYAREHNLKIVEITERPLKEGRLAKYDDIETIYNYDMGIEEWLGYIKYADCVFTNSFHSCCFSILFEKQLYVGMRNGDKVTHVLDMFGLNDRRINRESDILTNPLPDIDYSKVRPILKQKQKESSEFILSAIRRMEQSQRPVRDYDEWKKSLSYKVHYNSGVFPEIGKGTYDKSDGEVKKLSTGSWELCTAEKMKNNGEVCLKKNKFSRKGYLPDGWKIRFRIDKKWFWYLENDTFVSTDEYNKEIHPPIRKFKEGEKIPYIPVNKIAIIVADAIWKEGSLSYPVMYHEKNKDTNLKKEFVGWRICVEEDEKEYWYLNNGTLQRVEDYCEDYDAERAIIDNDAKIPDLPASYIDKVILKGVWKDKIKYTIGGLYENAGRGTYDSRKGRIEKSHEGIWEFCPKEALEEENLKLYRNEFSRKGYLPDGWKIRLKTKNGWKWYLEDGTSVNVNEYNENIHSPIRKFAENDVLSDVFDENVSYIAADAVWKKESNCYRIVFNSGLESDTEYSPEKRVANDGQENFDKNPFEYPGYEFVGWRMKVESCGKWYWYLNDGTLQLLRDHKASEDGKIPLFKDMDSIPYLPANHIDTVLLEGVWKTQLAYFSGNYTDVTKGTYDSTEGTIEKLSGGMWRFQPKGLTMCNGSQCFIRNEFCRKGYLSDGWYIKAKIDGQWNWYLKDSSFMPVEEYDEQKHPEIRKFLEYTKIPELWDNKVTALAAEAAWKKDSSEYKVIYNCGVRNRKVSCKFDETRGNLKILASGSVEYELENLFANNGQNKLLANAFHYPGYHFLGWRMRIKADERWFWYLQDGTLKPQGKYSQKNDGKRYLLKDETNIPYIPANEVTVVVLEGVWRVKIKTWIARKLRKLRGQK
ncbi:MAG: polysaccharide pyruvyl transferase family protein [Lachnospiraceae bacterium]